MVAVVIPMNYGLNHFETGLGEMRESISRVQMLLSFTGNRQQRLIIQYK